jgi:capsular polysaccharide biosynthesis protein
MRPMHWVRRRLWVVLVTTALAAVAAGLVDSNDPEPRTAEAVLVVSSGANAGDPGRVTEANRLATTLAQVIPDDAALLDFVSPSIGLTRDQVDDDLAVVAVDGTSILRVYYSNDDPQAAVTLLNSLVGALSSPTPPTPTVAPGTLVLVEPAQLLDAEEPRGDLAPVLGGILGLLLGVFLVVIWERSSPRVLAAADLRLRFPSTPANDLDGLRPAVATTLVTRWAQMVQPGNTEVALLGMSPGRRPTSMDLAKAFHSHVASSADPVIRSAGLTFAAAELSGSGEAERLAMGSGLVVLLVTAGTPLERVESTVSSLEQYGTPVAWMVFANPGQKIRFADVPGRSRRGRGGPGARGAGGEPTPSSSRPDGSTSLAKMSMTKMSIDPSGLAIDLP